MNREERVLMHDLVLALRANTNELQRQRLNAAQQAEPSLNKTRVIWHQDSVGNQGAIVCNDLSPIRGCIRAFVPKAEMFRIAQELFDMSRRRP